MSVAYAPEPSRSSFTSNVARGTLGPHREVAPDLGREGAGQAFDVVRVRQVPGAGNDVGDGDIRGGSAGGRHLRSGVLIGATCAPRHRREGRTGELSRQEIAHRLFDLGSTAPNARYQPLRYRCADSHEEF